MVKTFTRAVLCTLLATLAMISSDAFAATYIAYSSSGMSARQSSDFSSDPGANGASAALDGNTSAGSMAGWNGGFLLDKNGEKTSSNNNLDYGINWWTVDFGKELSIDAVKIFFEENSETHASATEFKVEYFDVDPSPADSYVNVAADKALGDVSVYSLEGTLVNSVRTDDNVVVLDIADLSSGIYVVRAAGATVRLIKK